MDIAVNLVENYLRLNGYMTLSELEVQRRDKDGKFRSVTDIDIMAIRFPGDVYLGDPHAAEDYELLLVDDPVLALEDNTIDVIVGEVKQGQAEFNPGIKDGGVLHTMLRRVGWIYEGGVDDVIATLQESGIHRAPSRGGATVRTRLVAFGRSRQSNLNTISLSHIVTTLLAFLDEHEDAFRPIQFREPAPAFLSLLLKAGFDVNKPKRSEHE